MINLVLCLLEGEKGYKNFLKGGKEMDDLCLKSPEDNLAFQLSIQDIIYNNLLNVETTLVVNYDYKLRNFVSFCSSSKMALSTFLLTVLQPTRAKKESIKTTKILKGNFFFMIQLNIEIKKL